MSLLRDFLLHPAPPADQGRDAPSAGTALAGAAAEAVPRAGAWIRPDAAVTALAPEVAVLAAPGQVAALGAAVALLLVRRARAGAGVVLVWAPGHPPPAGGAAVVRPAARRLASVLDGRGLDATAAGRLVTVVLPEDPAQAAAAATRAVAAAHDRPAVLALGGRAAPFDALLAAQDRVLLVPPPGADPALTGLALAGLGDAGGRAHAYAAEATPVARTVLATGLTVPSSLRRALGSALDGLAP